MSNLRFVIVIVCALILLWAISIGSLLAGVAAFVALLFSTFGEFGVAEDGDEF